MSFRAFGPRNFMKAIAATPGPGTNCFIFRSAVIATMVLLTLSAGARRSAFSIVSYRFVIPQHFASLFHQRSVFLELGSCGLRILTMFRYSPPNSLDPSRCFRSRAQSAMKPTPAVAHRSDTDTSSRVGSLLRTVGTGLSLPVDCRSLATRAALHGVFQRFVLPSPSPLSNSRAVTVPTMACPPLCTWTCSTVTFCLPVFPFRRIMQSTCCTKRFMNLHAFSVEKFLSSNEELSVADDPGAFAR
jgi:hypothetical protein